jgi:hypothetical protein
MPNGARNIGFCRFGRLLTPLQCSAVHLQHILQITHVHLIDSCHPTCSLYLLLTTHDGPYFHNELDSRPLRSFFAWKQIQQGDYRTRHDTDSEQSS